MSEDRAVRGGGDAGPAVVAALDDLGTKTGAFTARAVSGELMAGESERTLDMDELRRSRQRLTTYSNLGSSDD